MKNNRIRVVALLLALCLLTTLLTACKANEKVFTKDCFTITLTESFVEREDENLIAVYTSPFVVVTVAKEDRKQGSYDMSLYEYTRIVLWKNSLNCRIMSTNDYLTFSYTETLDGVEYYSYVTTHETFVAFWVVQFVCKEKDKELFSKSFDKWASSIKVYY